MSTPDQPDTPQLTRRQLRELRNTASNPVITPEEAAAAATPVVAPLPRAAEPVVAEDPPAAADVDLGAPALTRRAARQQERLRTASVPVVEAHDVPEAATVDEAAVIEAELVEAELVEAEIVDADAAPSADAAGSDDHDEGGETLEQVHTVDLAPADLEPHIDADVDVLEDAEAAAERAGAIDDAEHAVAVEETEETADALAESQTESPDVEIAADVEAVAAPSDAGQRSFVAPTFGSGLLAGESVELELPASFDQLLSRGSNATGSLAATNALILSQTPDTGSFVSPVASTGEVLITGTFNLPESFGSTGTSRGSSDGKEIDAILVDGELPASSSPTPIAASSAISTIKSAEDIIKPPAPEKGSRLMLALVITAGALALALTGVLIVALVTGAFR